MISHNKTGHPQTRCTLLPRRPQPLKSPEKLLNAKQHSCSMQVEETFGHVLECLGSALLDAACLPSRNSSRTSRSATGPKAWMPTMSRNFPAASKLAPPCLSLYRCGGPRLMSFKAFHCISTKSLISSSVTRKASSSFARLGRSRILVRAGPRN